ncbi:MAG: radical SAM protein [Chloroflexota bacterium]|nr:radical SAM protein [Chloroflexota bacterium]
MTVREIQARVLLSPVKQPDTWFGLKYNMNLYRGCQHGCIYCDSRSECYGINDFDGEVLVKANAVDLLRQELARKRVKGYIGSGSMNDPYMPVERKLGLTGRALEVVAEFAFPIHILTKSDLVLRDLDTLEAINRTSAVVSFTITTPDDGLARQVEPGAPSPTARFRAMATLAERGIRTGVVLMPVLPFLQDDPDSIAQIVIRAHESGASHVIPSFGMTLRDRQREHFYGELDRRFPGLSRRYRRAFGDSYFAPVDRIGELETVLDDLITRFGLLRRVPPYRPVDAQQLSLF